MHVGGVLLHVGGVLRVGQQCSREQFADTEFAEATLITQLPCTEIQPSVDLDITPNCSSAGP